jgi:hypothetical protein
MTDGTRGGKGVVTKTLELPASADDVWAVVGDFNGLARWNAGVLRSDLSNEGQRRTLTLKTGGSVIEDLIDYDWAARRCSYRIVESAVPVLQHKATLSVADRGPGRCTVHWSCEFYPKDTDVEAVSAIFTAIFDRGLKQLEQMFRK